MSASRRVSGRCRLVRTLLHRLMPCLVVLATGAAAATPQESAVAAPLTESDVPPIASSILAELEPTVSQQLVAARDAVLATLERDDEQEAHDSYGRLCLLYLRFDLLDLAEPCLARMRGLAPEQMRWPYYELLLHTRRGEGARARHDAELALALSPNDVPTLVRYGDLWLEASDVERARSAYDRALEIQPDNAGARFGRGLIAAAEGLTEEAIDHFEAALVGQPSGSLVHYQLGLALRDAGELDRARDELARGHQQPVVFPDPLLDELSRLGESGEEVLAAGVRALDAGRVDEAIAAFRRVLASRPDDAEAHYDLGLALVRTNAMAEAEAHFRRAIELKPDYGAAHYNLAILLGRSDRRAEAREHLGRAAAIEPGNLPWRVLWARALADGGELARATDEMEKVVALDPALPDARAALGSLLAAQGAYEQAARHFTRLTELRPEDPQGWYGSAMSNLRRGAYTEAARVLEGAVERFPGELVFRHLLARLLATCPDDGVRDGARAVALARELVERERSVDHAETLAMALAEVGRFDEAVEWQRRVIDQERSARGQVSPERQAHLESFAAHRPVRATWN